MVEIAEIVDRKMLESWMAEVSKPKVHWVASRSVARSLPFGFSKNFAQGRDVYDELSILLFIRALLLSGIFARVRDENVAGRISDLSQRAFRDEWPYSGPRLPAAPYDLVRALGPSSATPSFAAHAVRSANEEIETAKPVANDRGLVQPVLWSELRHDISLVAVEWPPRGIKLWNNANQASGQWSQAKSLLAGKNSWAFWLDWYQRLLDGTEDRWDLLRDIALLDKDADGNDLWQDPEKLAAEIARLEAEYAAKQKADPAELLMAESLMQAAIFDFGFDTVRQLMAMQPFAEDLAVIQDDANREAFLDAADEMREDIERLAEGLRREGSSMQGAGLVSTDLDALLEEFSKARQLNKLNAGKIVKFGEFLQSATLDKSTRDEFGALATKRLEQIVDGVLGLVKSYFGRALMRYAPLDELELEPGTSAWEYLNELRNALRDMRDGTDPLGVTPLAPENIAVLDAIAAEIERVMVAEASADGPAKSSLQREINHKLALLTVSISLYASRARQHEGRLGPHVDDLLKQVRRAKGLGALWAVFKRLLGVE